LSGRDAERLELTRQHLPSATTHICFTVRS
jgi:hypothetical protein